MPSTLPCNECAKPVDSEIHAEELGLCLDCSNDYFATECETCHAPIAGGNPFSRYCDTHYESEAIITECKTDHFWIGSPLYCSACGVDKGNESEATNA